MGGVGTWTRFMSISVKSANSSAGPPRKFRPGDAAAAAYFAGKGAGGGAPEVSRIVDSCSFSLFAKS